MITSIIHISKLCSNTFTKNVVTLLCIACSLTTVNAQQKKSASETKSTKKNTTVNKVNSKTSTKKVLPEKKTITKSSSASKQKLAKVNAKKIVVPTTEIAKINTENPVKIIGTENNIIAKQESKKESAKDGPKEIIKEATKLVTKDLTKQAVANVDTLFKYKYNTTKTTETKKELLAKKEPEKVAPKAVEKEVKQIGYAESKIKPVEKNTDANKISKKKPTFSAKDSKSAQDPNALNFSGFKVSRELYGDYAPIIYDYVKNYHGNFGNYLGRIKSNNKSNMALIDNAMRKAGLPKEFRSLAVIESGLNPNAVSPVGAVGPWQFMEPTAEMLGLRVDETIDERRDFNKSTLAAAKYCKRLHNMFHDWLLVVASYNCGPSPIIRHLQRTGGTSFWDIKQFLPKETQNHVMAFIATSAYYDKNTKVLDLGGTPKAAAMAYAKTKAAELKAKDIAKAAAKPKASNAKANPKKQDDEDDLAIAEEEAIKPFDPNAPLYLDGEMSQVVILKVKGAYNLETISELLDYEISKLRRWNPNFNKLAAENIGLVKLVLPMSGLDAFLIQKEKILSQSVRNPRANTNNETVATKYKIPTTVKVTKEANSAKSEAKPADKIENKSNATPITKAVTKPELKTEKPIVASNTNNDATNAGKEKITNVKKKYVIKQGDQLTKIAETFGITVEKLRELNQGEIMVLKPGHTLYLE